MRRGARSPLALKIWPTSPSSMSSVWGLIHHLNIGKCCADMLWPIQRAQYNFQAEFRCLLYIDGGEDFPPDHHPTRGRHDQSS